MNSGAKTMNEDTYNIPFTLIPDSCVPLVIFFGPRACGKTMTMVRMVRFLLSEGYKVIPIRTLRPEYDQYYHRAIDNFEKLIYSDFSPETEYRWGFMLVEIVKDNKCICYMLDIPGDYCHDPHWPNANFPDFLNSIIVGANPKVWMIMTEPDWMSQMDREKYVLKIGKLRLSMRSKDSVVLVYNKIDKTYIVCSPGNVDKSAAVTEVKVYYPNIFLPFINKNPITRLWKKYNCDFVPFQTGYYSEAVNGFTYIEGPREYCVKLWKCIMSRTAN